MKLRNKKTGELSEFIDIYADGSVIYFRFQDEKGIFKERINSLSELNAEWEDYTPKEPLIMDEKTRKLVKDWALMNKIHAVFYDSSNALLGTERGFMHIVITRLRRENLEDAHIYTITELCGEEE